MNIKTFASADSRVRIFCSPTSWIEGAAVQQLEQIARRPGVNSVAGMPDLHPGHHGPVGCAVETEHIVHPDIIGTDIGCGMQFWLLELPQARLRIDKAAERMAALEGPWNGDPGALLESCGIASDGCGVNLGTVGGGNHFCELQTVVDILDPVAAEQAHLRPGLLALLVHSGSRDLGATVLERHYHCGTAGLTLENGGRDYLADHDNAVRFASLNRRVIAERALAALRTEGRMLADIPHNLVEVEGSRILHRKGAAPATRGLVPVPGSRGSVTYLVEPLPSPEGALQSIAHGAGRRHNRGSMDKRVGTKASDIRRLERNPFGGHVLCSDRRLLIEEAPKAYKDVHKVVDDMTSHKMIRVVATMAPLVTFKKMARMRQRDGGQRR
ncbi:MAG: RNA ligase RtcB family protein [Alphaproteobacteria bacterium]|nr:RNA ligase RtcB family protein [Alphaproteobacteria bacterium]